MTVINLSDFRERGIRLRLDHKANSIEYVIVVNGIEKYHYDNANVAIRKFNALLDEKNS